MGGQGWHIRVYYTDLGDEFVSGVYGRNVLVGFGFSSMVWSTRRLFWSSYQYIDHPIGDKGPLMAASGVRPGDRGSAVGCTRLFSNAWAPNYVDSVTDSTRSSRTKYSHAPLPTLKRLAV